MTQPNHSNLPPVDNFHPLNPETLGIPHQALERRAYELYLEAGSPEGRGFEHWQQAERELLAGYLPRQAEQRVIVPAAKRKKAAVEPVAPAPLKAAAVPKKATRSRKKS